MKRNMLAPLIAICVILLALSVGSFFFTPDRAFPKMRTATCRSCQSFPKIPW